MRCTPERARSLSPTKDNPSMVETPGSLRSKNELPMQDESCQMPSLQPIPSRDLGFNDSPKKTNGDPTMRTSVRETTNPRETPQPLLEPQTLTHASSDTAAPLPRSGALSWQQRPSSRGTEASRVRPMSMLAPDKMTTLPLRQTAQPATSKDQGVSMDHIKQSLGSRDPSWFKQTQERGVGSAAFRRNQVEDTPEVAFASNSMLLPGMPRGNTMESKSRTSPAPDSVRSISPSMESSIKSTLGSSQGVTNSGSLSFRSEMRSPLPILASQRFEPPSSETISTSGDDAPSNGGSLAMSPSQGRISPERGDRPISPTKGLGGFVQSAMLKRSDSVNKRWNTQAGLGLSRGNSIASNTSGYGASKYPLTHVTPLTESGTNGSREGSPKTHSRLTSSHTNASALQRLTENDKPGTAPRLPNVMPQPQSEGKDPAPKPKEVESSLQQESIASPPSSPSRRWSPTKSTWLENAINKPESPRMKLPPPQQPSWMADLNRAKRARGSVDEGTESTFKGVTNGGLARPPPPGSNLNTPSGDRASPDRIGSVVQEPQRKSTKNNDSTSAIGDIQPVPNIVSQETRTASNLTDRPSGTPKVQTNPTPAPKSISSSPKTSASPKASRRVSSSNTKPKPETPPKKDFKPPLRVRQTSGAKKTQEELEFKNVFGNLKRTQTKNYVAPDKFKDNITRGKAALAQTGGPKKTELKDEFKESILQKKQRMVAPSASTTITSVSSKTQEQASPEGIARQKSLARSESEQSNRSTADDAKRSTPEALAKLQYLRDKSKIMPVEDQLNTPANRSKVSDSSSRQQGDFPTSLAGVLQRGPLPMAVKPTKPHSPNRIRHGDSTGANESQKSSGGPQLTHATKARARGPKRRLPTASAQQASKPISPHDEAKDKPVIPTPTSKSTRIHASPNQPKPSELNTMNRTNNNTRKPSQPPIPRKSSTTIALSPDPHKAAAYDVGPPNSEKSKLQSPPSIKQKPLLSPKGVGTREQLKSTAISPVDTQTDYISTQSVERISSYPANEAQKTVPKDEDPDA